MADVHESALGCDGRHRFLYDLIMDRDTKFTEAFGDALEREGIQPIRCPPRAPTCNTYAERFVRSIKEKCLDRMILLGERSLRHTLREYEIHYNSRNATTRASTITCWNRPMSWYHTGKRFNAVNGWAGC